MANEEGIGALFEEDDKQVTNVDLAQSHKRTPNLTRDYVAEYLRNQAAEMSSGFSTHAKALLLAADILESYRTR